MSTLVPGIICYLFYVNIHRPSFETIFQNLHQWHLLWSDFLNDYNCLLTLFYIFPFVSYHISFVCGLSPLSADTTLSFFCISHLNIC